MRSGRSIAPLSLLLAYCAGCGVVHHKTAPPPVAQAPSLPPAQMASLISPMPPALPPFTSHSVKLDTTVPPEVEPAVASSRPRHMPHHRTKPAAQETAQQQETPKAAAPAPDTPASPVPPQTPPENPAQAASGQPSEASPIGQLSTSTDNTNAVDRHEIIKTIDSTENGLNSIRRSLSSDEQKTAAQIRAYLARARDALKADDLDGARTQSTKAHILLEELTKQ